MNCFHIFQVPSEEFGGLPTVFPERRQIKEEADQSMEWAEADPLGVDEQEPESIVPDQEEEEEGDISQESEEDISDSRDSGSSSSSDDDDEQLAKPARQTGFVLQNLSSDSDSGVEDAQPLSKAEAAKRSKKEARTRREEKWAMEEDGGEGEEGAVKDERYKDLPKIENPLSDPLFGLPVFSMLIHNY